MAGKNTLTRRIAPKTVIADGKVAVSSSTSYNQGDLLVFDTSTHLLRIPTVETEGNLFVGIAVQTIVNGHVADVYSTAVDASVAITSIEGPEYGDVHKCIAKTGDAFTVGCLVYLDPATGSRGVTVTGTKSIGVYQGKALTATAGQEVEVLIGARSPNDVLKF